MQCERLIQLTKQWFTHVKAETMAPARMIQFIKNHAESCEVCIADPDLDDEITKITEMILPDSKIPKAVRLQQEEEEDIDPDEEEDDEEEDTDSEDDEEEEEYMDDDDDLDDEDIKAFD